MAKRTIAEELQELLGEYVSIQLNDIKMFEKLPELQAMALAPTTEGYVIDVSDNFIYIGTKTSDSYDTLISHSMVAFISIIDPEDGNLEIQFVDEMPEPGETMQ